MVKSYVRKSKRGRKHRVRGHSRRKKKFKLHIRKLPNSFGKYKYEVFGGFHGGKHHSSLHKTKSSAMKHKQQLTKYAEKNPHLIQFR